MRRIFCILMILLLLPCAHAEDDNRVAAHLPALTFTVTDTGKGTDNALRPYLLAVEAASADGTFRQTVTWESNEHPDSERTAIFVRLVDYNFDGFKDLQLLAAQGARNTFFAVALWHEEQGRFLEVERHNKRLPGGKTADKVTQVEFCNPDFYPDGNPYGRILSVEEDGFRYRTEYVYTWEGRYYLETRWVASVYDAGEGLIGESLDQWGTGLDRWWDQTFPEGWYYGKRSPAGHRMDARRLLMLDRGTVDPYWMQVSNVDWVNFRQLDSKESPSLAKLNRGTTVQALTSGCGEGGGWMLVCVSNSDVGLKTGIDAHHDREVDGMIGYIWHSYLEPCWMFVANVDWVNVREKPDKQSAVVTTLTEGTRVHRRPADEKDGWIPVSGWDTEFTGWIWHSYLEAEPFFPYKWPDRK